MRLRKRRDDGAVSAEYAFMVLAIALVVVIAVQLTGSNLLSDYMDIAAAI